MAMDTQSLETSRDAAMTPPVAVVILNWNGRGLLERYLPQVVKNSAPDISRIIVADNGSTDSSCEFVEIQFPEVELIKLDKNYGFAEGYNRVIAMLTQYPYVVLLNSDATGAPGWDKALYDYMESHPKAGACQPKILSDTARDTFEYAGAAGGFLDRNGYPYCRGRIFDVCERDNGQYDSDIEVHWASGAALMVRRRVYIDCGGLDKDFFAHMEEIDLCWRIRLAGYSIAAISSSAVYHLGGGSLSSSNPRKTYLNFRNNLLMLHKNLPESVRKRKLVWRRLLDTLAWGMYTATFRWKHAAAIVKAHRDFARMCKSYTEHPEVNLLGRDSDSRRNILVEFYAKRHRRYSDL